jgi:hypothetical protein
MSIRFHRREKKEDKEDCRPWKRRRNKKERGEGCLIFAWVLGHLE